MAGADYEFLGNDRFFKYKHAQLTNISITTIEETWNMPNNVQRYKILQEYLERAFNLKVFYDLHKVPFLNLTKIYTEPDVFNEANFIMIPMSLSFFDGRQERFTPSPVFETARTIIVSAAPKKVLSTSLSFLNMDTEVEILIVSTVVLLSILFVVHSIVTNKYKSLSTKIFVRKLVHETLENVWEYSSLFCAEPIPVVLPHITCRLLASSWLIGVTFILAFLGCVLHTEFTTETYICIDTLSDLIKSGIPPTVVKEGGTLDNLKYLAAKDPILQKWLDELDLEKVSSSLKACLDNDEYIPIISGEKALITEDTFLLWFLGELLASDSESNEIFVKKGGLYFSQQEVGFDYLHLVFNTTWMKSNPQVHENIQLGLVPIVETQVFKYLDFQFNYYIDQVMWKKPLKSTSDMDIRSVIVPFYLLFALLLGTVIIVITEIVLNKVA